jgi:hypothetical protein
MSLLDIWKQYPEVRDVLVKRANKASYVPWIYKATIKELAFFAGEDPINLLEELNSKISKKKLY